MDKGLGGCDMYLGPIVGGVQRRSRVFFAESGSKRGVVGAQLGRRGMSGCRPCNFFRRFFVCKDAKSSGSQIFLLEEGPGTQ